MVPGRARRLPREWWVHSAAGFWLGLLICVGVVVADAIGDRLVLIPLLVAAPLLACASASTLRTAVVGIVAIAAAVALGWVDDIEFTRRHWVLIVTVALGAVLAVWLAFTRTAREHELRKVDPERERARELAFALHAGRVGSWTWDVETGTVAWDAQLFELFGVRPGQFAGTFDDWIDKVDERDRDMLRRRLGEVDTLGRRVRFDHRCVWPDGAVHWLEVVAEPVFVRGRITGAFGLTIDIDDRVAEVDERNRLLDIERDARERSEYLGRVNMAIGETLEVGEILQRVTASVVPGLADWCSIVVAVDRARHQPLIVYTHADPDEMARGAELLRTHPFDPDADFGAAKVLRTGVLEFVREIPTDVFRGDAAVLTPFAIRSAITVPLRGSLGILGSLQVIRTDDRVFDDDDVDLLGELASRIGSALNNAVLYARQLKTEALLDTLQAVAGRLNAAATRSEIRGIVTTHDWSSVGVESVRLTLYDDRGTVVSSDTWGTVRDSRTAGDALELPLVMMHQLLGTLQLQFVADRLLTREDRSTFETIADRCAGGLERALLFEQARDSALMLQRRLMPTLPDLPPWLEVAAEYQPAPGGEVGGDWYQLIEADGGRIVAVVGDAVGHGLGAAAAMGQLRGAIAGAVASDTDPDRVLAAVERIALTASDMMYATIVYVLLDAGPVIRYASAGHLPPARVRPGEKAQVIEGGRRPLLGAGSPHAMPVAASAEFAVGDTIVLYTDGLIERRREPIDLGVQRLLDALEQLAAEPVEVVCRRLVDLLAFGRDIEDDLALIVLRRV